MSYKNILGVGWSGNLQWRHNRKTWWKRVLIHHLKHVKVIHTWKMAAVHASVRTMTLTWRSRDMEFNNYLILTTCRKKKHNFYSLKLVKDCVHIFCMSESRSICVLFKKCFSFIVNSTEPCNIPNLLIRCECVRNKWIIFLHCIYTTQLQHAVILQDLKQGVLASYF